MKEIIKNIIRKMQEVKKARKIEPEHITDIQILKEMRIIGYSAIETRKGLNALITDGFLEYGETLNNIWFKIRANQ